MGPAPTLVSENTYAPRDSFRRIDIARLLRPLHESRRLRDLRTLHQTATAEWEGRCNLPWGCSRKRVSNTRQIWLLYQTSQRLRTCRIGRAFEYYSDVGFWRRGYRASDEGSPCNPQGRAAFYQGIDRYYGTAGNRWLASFPAIHPGLWSAG